VNFADAIALVRSGTDFLVTCHRRPDADALGSALGLARILKRIGKRATVFVPETLPLNLRFLPAPGEIVLVLPDDARFDATFVTDTAAASLLPVGLPPREVRGPLVVVDHHAAHDDVGDVIVRDVKACATGEIVVRIADELGAGSFDESIAQPLYAAIVADTGGFRYPVTTAATLRIGARLLEAGADPWLVAYHLFEGWEAERLRLLGMVLDTLETELDGKLALLRVTRAMLASCGANDDMVEGMVNYGRMLLGVQVACLLWEWPVALEDGTSRIDTKVSLRSRGVIDISRIAVALGGGGHRGAAGAQLPGDLDAARKLVVAEARKLLEV